MACREEEEEASFRGLGGEQRDRERRRERVEEIDIGWDVG
jgi:hypothetical protein